MRAQCTAALWLMFVGAARAAGVDPTLPHYEPRAVAIEQTAGYMTADGSIAIVGYNDMRDLMEAWVARFTRMHPNVHFALDLRGTRFAPAALASGTSLFAPMGAEFTPSQLADYRIKTGVDPVAFRVAHASLRTQALSGPLGIFVHRDNPIASLTLEQLSRAFAGETTRWGELGYQGTGAERNVHTYGVERGTPLALSFVANAMGGRALGLAMTGFPQSADVVQAVASDRDGLGFAAAMRVTPAVRLVPIAPRPGDEPIALTAANLIAGRYPLDRHLLIYARRPLTPIAREFLRMALSREGQEAVAATPQGYLPLSASDAAVERTTLDRP